MLCGGIGSRLNCSLFPKPLTLIKGVPLIYRVIDTLSINNLTFITNQHLKSYNFEEMVSKYVTDMGLNCKLNFWYLPHMTRGSLESLYLFLVATKLEGQIVVLDNDNLYGLSQDTNLSGNGIIYFNTTNNSNRYSFILRDSADGHVIRIAEKERISDDTCIGYYIMVNSMVISLMRQIITSCSEKEFYLSHLYKELLNMNIKVSSYFLPSAAILGTNDDIRDASCLKVSSDNLKERRVVYDLDNTLITPDITPKSANWSKTKPIERHVEFLKYLKSEGWYIIIHTARGMLNNNLSMEKMKLVTETLSILNIPYDEIVFGKPYADLYIDDKAHNPYDDNFYTKIGFGNYTSVLAKLNIINKANVILRTSYDTIAKHSKNDCRGEINYYNFVSSRPCAKMFPSLIKYGKSTLPDYNEFLELEYVSGPTFSDLYLEGLLGNKQFSLLLDKIDLLHSSGFTDDVCLSKYDYVKFYSEKFYSRTKLYESESWYSRPVMKTIETWLMSYLASDIETSNIVHGDLWFPNIILSYGEIKLIDMRGLVGDSITIKGDRNYDYAKLYQSLIGMDSIIKSQPILVDNDMISMFLSRYSDRAESIKMMSAYTIYCSLYSWSSNHSGLWKLIEKIIYPSIL